MIGLVVFSVSFRRQKKIYKFYNFLFSFCSIETRKSAMNYGIIQLSRVTFKYWKVYIEIELVLNMLLEV